MPRRGPDRDPAQLNELDHAGLAYKAAVRFGVCSSFPHSSYP